MRTAASLFRRAAFYMTPGAPVGEEKPFVYTSGLGFFDPQLQPTTLSFYNRHTLTILPPDVTPPQIESSLLSFSQHRLSGSPGAVADDWINLPDGIQLELYNQNDSLVTFSIADSVGDFHMYHFYLERNTRATLGDWDLLQNHAEYTFK